MMANEVEEVLAQLRESMPPLFAGPKIDHYTGNGVRWRTVQNEKSRGETPAGMFVRHGGRKLLVVRDVFISYLRGKLSNA